MDIIVLVLAIVMGVMGVYSNYMNWKIFFKARSEKERFQKNHKDCQVFVTGRGKIVLFVFLAVFCIGFGLYFLLSPTAQLNVDGNDSVFTRGSQALLYIALGVYAAGEIADNITNSRILYTPDGFMPADEYYRYRNVLRIEVGSNFFKATTMYLIGGKEVPLSKTVGRWAQEQFELWKENRKQMRAKGRKGRKAEAK